MLVFSRRFKEKMLFVGLNAGLQLSVPLLGHFYSSAKALPEVVLVRETSYYEKDPDPTTTKPIPSGPAGTCSPYARPLPLQSLEAPLPLRLTPADQQRRDTFLLNDPLPGTRQEISPPPALSAAW